MNAKLDIGGVFERLLQIYRDQFAVLIGAALLLFLPLAIINGFLTDEGGVLSLVAALLSLVVGFWYTGMVVEAARDILDGRRDHSIGKLLSSVTPVLGALIVAGVLAGIGIAIGLVLVIIPGLFLITIWAVIAPVIVLERTGALASFGRSRELVKGNGWQVFGVLVLLFIAAFIVRIILAAIFAGLDSVIGLIIAELIVNLLFAPLTALAAAVIYFELKRVKGEPVLQEGGAPVPAPTTSADMPPAAETPPPAPGSPPPAAPPPGGSTPAGGDASPPSGGPQAPPNA